MWSNEEVGWKGLYLDVKRWMDADGKFSERVMSLVKRRGSGRGRLDEGDKGWQDAFCEAFFKHNGNKEKARVESGCPYSLRRINEMLEPANSAYDKDFAEKVLEQQLRFTADFEEMAFSLRDPEAYVDTNASKIAMNKSVVATRILEKVSKATWGREVNFKGSVQHLHQLESRYRNPNEMIAELADSYRQFQQEKMKQIAPGAPQEEAIDAEVVDETPDES